MENINVAIIAGNLTRDPELRATVSGSSVLGFGVAVNERRKNKSGEWEDYPNFVDVTMFGPRADILSRYLRKGMKVTVRGKLHYSQWEKDGQKRSKLEVIADLVELPPSGGRQDGAQDQQPAYAADPQPTYIHPGAQAQQAYSDAVYDEEIPF